MRFDNAGLVEAVVWNSRIADLPRAENRTIINRTFNGDPPFTKEKAEENNIEINRNFLEGTRILSDARLQWNANFLKPGNQFNLRAISGPKYKRQAWGHAATESLNRILRGSLRRTEEIRATGSNTLLHGIGPVLWPDRRTPLPEPIPISSLLIPSETEISFENLEWFAVFREYTPSMLYAKTHGPKVDPGWDLKSVMRELRWAAEQDQKEPNATAYQYMPERIEEMVKQDMGYWGSDAVPTIDAWDVYFRESESQEGWYRRMILDWGLGDSELSSRKNSSPPDTTGSGGRNRDGFLYSSGKRRYANDRSEILHCQFGDCSCVAPFKYHSVRSLGWMLWGVSDLQNRLRCKITEQAFSDLMWWFRTASASDLQRVRKANFLHMGAIPAGVDFLKPGDRYSPAPQFIELVLQQNRQLMSENAASYTRDSGEGREGEMTATEVMSRANSVNTLVSGVMNLAYTYEKFKGVEILRRLLLKGNPDRRARDFRKDLLHAGVPEDHLVPEIWECEAERAVGNGNKTVEMGIVQYLNSVRKNFGPDAQRHVDHLCVEIVTQQADLAEDLAPLKQDQAASPSTHDAEMASQRLMSGLPFTPPKSAIYEDYVVTWLRDMAVIVQQGQQSGGMVSQQQIVGLTNMVAHVKKFLDFMAKDSDADEKAKVRSYEAALSKLENFIRAFQQRLAQQMKAQQSQAAQGNGKNPMLEAQSKIQADQILAQAKAQNARESHAARTAQKQISFELQEQRRDRELQADIRRKNLEHAHELQHTRAARAQELVANRLRSLTE
jgi:hypothetical protein